MSPTVVLYITAVMLLVEETQGAEIITYQQVLSETLAMNKDCGNAFNDCCQAKVISSVLQYRVLSTTYEITDVCNDGPFAIPNKVLARCDMECDGGGWLVIQRRVPGGTVDFYRDWNDYEQGFGDLETEFWWGLRNIHCLTTREDVELKIELKDENGNNMTWTYERFTVDGPDNKYQLHIGSGVGPSGAFDAMAYHNNQFFSTKDRDNDNRGIHCAQVYKGAWWYNSCFHSNLNGPHDLITPPPPDRHANRIVWWGGNGWAYMSFVEMKVRPKTCQVETCNK